MNSQTSTLKRAKVQAPPSLLRKALIGNATFSGLSGSIFLLASESIATFLGVENPLILTITGIVLIFYAPFLVWLANQNPDPRFLVWLVIELDILWVIGSAVLIFSNLIPLTVPGKWAIAILADTVAIFAIVQYVGLRKQG
jgi:hypothetical protein